MTEPMKYRKKPVVVEAMQWDGTAEGATSIVDWVLISGGSARYDCNSESRERTGDPMDQKDPRHEPAIRRRTDLR